MSRKRNTEPLPKDAHLVQFEPGWNCPVYFKRPDSEKLFGIPPRVLEDLAMKKEGPPYYRRGKYSIYEVTAFVEWLTQNPIKTSNDYE